MDLNFQETVEDGGDAIMGKVSDCGVEEERERDAREDSLSKTGRDSSFCVKDAPERDEKEEETEISKAEKECSAGVVTSKRASTRKWSLVATEKILKLKEEVYEWERDGRRSRKRKDEKNGDTGSGIQVELGETNVEGQSVQRRRGRPRKNVKIEDGVLGGEETEMVEKNIQFQTAKRRRRKKKDAESDDTGLEGENEGVDKRDAVKNEDTGLGCENEGEQGTKAVKCEDTGFGFEAEGEEKNVEGQSTTKRQGRKRKDAESEVKELGDEGKEKYIEGQSTKKRRGRKRKDVESEFKGLGDEAEGKEKDFEGQTSKRKRGRPKKNVECDVTGLGGGEAEGKKETKKGQSTKGRRGRKWKDEKCEVTVLEDKGEEAEEEKNVKDKRLKRIRQSKRLNAENKGTVKDDKDKEVEHIGGKALEENVSDSC